MRRWSWAILLLMLAACIRAPHRGRDIGTVEFEVSCNEAARQRISEGVALIDHMLPARARRSFVAATAVDPACAMAHWGAAMSEVPPLYAGSPSEEAVESGLAELAKARELAPQTGRERDFIAAAEAFFRDGPDAWERAQRELHENYPDDVDAATFYALAALSNASTDDRSHAKQKAVLEALEPFREKYPRHPGVAHFLVHACDNAELAERGLAYARAYEELAPDLPTTAHSSSHIFVRLGLWSEVTKKNVGAASAAQRLAVSGVTPALYAHANDFLVYAYLQGGWDARALAVIRQLQRVQRWEPGFATAYALAAVPARYLLERQDWEKAAVIPVTPESFAWDDYPAARAITEFTRGIGAARSGDLDAARAAVRALEALAAEVRPAQSYWSRRVEAQRRAVAAWVAYGEGEVEPALEELRAAADLEDSMDEDRVSPGPVLPLRELLGDMLHEADHAVEALHEFETSLAAAPNRFYALYKAGRAAWKADDDAKSREYYWRLVRLVEASRCNRPEVQRAKNHLRLLGEPED